MFRSFFIGLLVCLASPLQAGAITLCNSPGFWPPYSYARGGTLGGEYSAILDEVFTELGLGYEQVVLPWRRCLDRVEKGELDGIISISYDETRAETYSFPPDAMADNPPSALSVVDFVIVTRADVPPPASISMDSLPEPVGAMLGYRVTADIQKAGKKTQVVALERNLFQMLDRGRIASAIMYRGAAEYYAGQSREPLVIHEPALWSLPHFLAFSVHSTVSAETRARIWQAIANLRSDSVRMAAIRARIAEDLKACHPNSDNSTSCD